MSSASTLILVWLRPLRTISNSHLPVGRPDLPQHAGLGVDGEHGHTLVLVREVGGEVPVVLLLVPPDHGVLYLIVSGHLLCEDLPQDGKLSGSSAMTEVGGGKCSEME